jgi:hypothetical protein
MGKRMPHPTHPIIHMTEALAGTGDIEISRTQNRNHLLKAQSPAARISRNRLECLQINPLIRHYSLPAGTRPLVF